MSGADPAKVRNLKIKSSVVKRYLKDLMGYKEEVIEQKAKIVKFKAEGKDEYFMKQQIGNLQESEMMVPNITNKFVSAQKDLKEILDLDETEGSLALKDTEEFKTALAILKESEAYLEESEAGANDTESPAR